MAKTYKNGKTKTRRNRKTNSNRRKYKKVGGEVDKDKCDTLKGRRDIPTNELIQIDDEYASKCLSSSKQNLRKSRLEQIATEKEINRYNPLNFFKK